MDYPLHTTVLKTSRSDPPIHTELIDPLVGDRWDSLVTQRDDHSVFHRSAWARVLAETYGHRPSYLIVDDPDSGQTLVPMMEVRSPITGRRGVSLPFSDFAPPLWSAPRQTEAVYKAIQEIAAQRKWTHFEIRGDFAPETDARPFRRYEAQRLDLSEGIEKLERNLPSSTKRAIRKAERNGLTLIIERNTESLLNFYQLHSRTRRRHGLPPQPQAFFQAMGRHLIEFGLGEVVMAYLGNTAVAGAVFFHSGSNAIYKFGASERAHWDRRPNHLVMWMAIRLLAENGFRSLHFGRTSTDDAGLLRFKHSWSCSAQPLDYFRYHVAKMAWLPSAGPHAESHPFVFGHLPISINRLAGRILYPHLD